MISAVLFDRAKGLKSKLNKQTNKKHKISGMTLAANKQWMIMNVGLIEKLKKTSCKTVH
jgi:hypothetical protein